MAHSTIIAYLLTLDGTPSDLHLVHLGSRAMGGAGLVYTEMTCVARDARISPGCTGMYEPEHGAQWKRIVDFVHGHSSAKIAMQLGHSGPKGSTKLMWDGMDEPLDEGNWPILGPSAVPYSKINQIPREMTRDDMQRVISEFESATRMAEDAGFDLLEIHAAHGYLLSAFITPLLNERRRTRVKSVMSAAPKSTPKAMPFQFVKAQLIVV